MLRLRVQGDKKGRGRKSTISDLSSGWLAVLLARLPLTDAARSELHSRLVARDGGDFVPDGKHRHSLTVGSNLARLQPVTVAALQRGAPRLGALMRSLGYLFTPPFVEGGGDVD